MIRRLLICFLFSCIFMSASNSYAQCTGGNSGGVITITSVWQSTLTTNIPGFTYYTFSATVGYTYYFSFCTADGGNSTKDTELSILNNSNVGMAGGYNDDFCGLQSYLAWVCPSTGTYRILVTKTGCANNANLGTMVYRYTSPLICPSNLGTGTIVVPSLPYSSGAGTTCGFGDDLNASNVTSCGSTSYLTGEDKVWEFTPAITGTITITLLSTGSYTGLMLYDGCPLNGMGGNCIATAQSSTGNKTITICVSAGNTYYLILDSYAAPTCNPYSNLTISAPIPAGGCNLGTGVVNISLPYSSSGRTTCGKVDDLTSANVVTCGSSLYLTGEDEVFVFTPATTGNININLTSSGSYTGMMLYDGCPLSTTCSGTASSCVAFEQSSSGSKTMCANVTAGITYYLIIDSWSTPVCNPYDISISAPAPTLAGATCANAVPISALPFSSPNDNTACTGNEYSNASIGSCGTLYESGEDKVYSYVASAAECLGITITGASSNSIGYQVYKGCPGVAGTTCIGNGGGANSGTLTGSVTLPAAGTYYIIIDTWAPPDNVAYSLAISSFGAGASNDLPCSATPLPLGVFVTGSNSCSGGTSEPAVPACWVTPNTLNTVWYSVQAPASGQLRVRAIPNSLTNTQVALYSGTCGSSMSLVACNDDAASCGSTTNLGSDLTVTGLTPSSTYYIVVDGYGSGTGTFGLIAIDGTTTLPALSNGQDCGTFLPVCDTVMSFGDPGFQSFGNICDFNGAGTCLTSGERGSVWFEIPINANGNLEFSIIPKDWPGSPSTMGTDYDYALWKTVGTGAVTCSQIATGSAPVSCNYSYLGITGAYSAVAGTSPAIYPGFGLAFNSQVPVLAGEKYILVVSNFSNSTSGFDIAFGANSPVSYAATGTSSTWSGGIDTDWFKKENWGGCPVPTCLRDAFINGGIVLQPTINGMGANCKSIIINPGATLTLPAGQSLSVCENFINYGLLNAAATSTVSMSNAAVAQNIDGSLTGGNAFGNLLENKTGSAVTLLQNADVKKNFTLSTATSVFNANGKYLKVGGDFSNSGTFTPGAGTLEFNGAAAQNYYNAGTLNSVVVNHNGSGVTLSTNMLIGTTGTLTLTIGKIITTASYEVSVANRTPAAVSTGNINSFIDGFLRRYINSQGSYDFPIGTTVSGFQRVNVNFAYPVNPTIIDNLRASFALHPSLPIALGVTDCGVLFSSSGLNNGKWTIVPSNNSTSGNFDLTLYNTNYTNAANAWTIQKNTGAGWVLGNGTCVVSPVTAVKRTAMNGFADFSTAQSASALPVELIKLNAVAETNSINVIWQTASETDNSGFEILRSTGSGNFTKVGWVNGAGNSTQLLSYLFIDHDVKKGVRYYYRLNQIDFNGMSQLSDVVSAKIDNGSSVSYIFPNPLNEDSKIVFELSQKADVEISLLDAIGKEVRSLGHFQEEEGVHQFSINPFRLGLEEGVYMVKLKADDHIEYHKVLFSGR